MYEPDHVDDDQNGHERNPRDRDVTSGELEPVSVDGVAACRSLLVTMSVRVGCLVLVVPLVARQLAAVCRHGRQLRLVVQSRRSHVHELAHVRQRKVIQR